MEEYTNLSARQQARVEQRPAPAEPPDDILLDDDPFFDDETPPVAKRRQPVSEPAAPPPHRPAWFTKRLVMILLGLVVVAGLAWGMMNLFRPSVPGVKSGNFQAVFLANGTVYIGKLSSLDGEHYRLTTVYFPQTIGSSASATEKDVQSPTGQVGLVKLGSELLGSEGEMVIRKDQVAYYENLKTDGQAAKLIADDLKKNP